jgi:hypothetical protein
MFNNAFASVTVKLNVNEVRLIQRMIPSHPPSPISPFLSKPFLFNPPPFHLDQLIITA